MVGGGEGGEVINEKGYLSTGFKGRGSGPGRGLGTQCLGSVVLDKESGNWVGSESSDTGWSSSSCRSLDSPLSFPLHIQFSRTFHWTYFQNASRLHPYLATCIIITMVLAAVISHLHNYKSLLFSGPPPLVAPDALSFLCSQRDPNCLLACEVLQDLASGTSLITFLLLLCSYVPSGIPTHLSFSEHVKGLCTCCSLSLECSSSRNPQGSLIPSNQVLSSPVTLEQNTPPHPTHMHTIPFSHFP